jgi:hypothetical protein
MSASTRRAGLAAAGVLSAVVAVAGCGSRPAPSTSPPPAPAPPPLTTSFTNAAGTTWTIVEMGGSAAQEENFWQLFVRSAGAAKWQLATPLGVADNGGLVVASPGSGSLVTGFRPSQLLTYSPLASSSDNGTSWSPAGPVNSGLADAPDALAAGPDGSLIALTSAGAELGQRLGAAWTRLSSARSLAATQAGKACGVTGLTAAAFSSSGTPILAASCSRPGVAGIFIRRGGTWQAAGPAVPASLSRQDIDVLRLTAAGPGLVALLQAGKSIVAAWYNGTRWTVSAPLPTGNSTVITSGGASGGWGGSSTSQSTASASLPAGPLTSTAIGPGDSVGIILNGSHGATLAGPGAAWHVLPALPKWAATLALGTSGQVDAIAANGGTFWDWRLATAGWSLAQKIHVAIPYGSSS